MAEDVNELHNAQTELPQGFGARIRAAREAAGISLGDMAVKSRLSVQQLRALEEEDVGALPEPVYVRAFIRGVAAILQLDAKSLQDDYSDRFGRGMGVNTSSIGQVPDRDPREELVINASVRHRGLKISFFVVFLLAIAAGGWALYTDQFGETTQTEAEKIELGVSESVPAVRSSEQEKQGSLPVDPAVAPSKPVEPAPAAEAANEPVTIPAAPVRSAQAIPSEEKNSAAIGVTNAHRVIFEATAPCWTQVTTPDQRRLLARELKPGERIELVVPKQSRFRIGNAAALTIKVDGDLYDYAHITRNGVASFVLQ